MSDTLTAMNGAAISAAPATDNRILIVDDTPANIQTLAAILKENGYQISVAQNGTQALAVVARVQPALILLDVMMPGMDGWETCRHLKANEEWAQIPIIFLTAKTETVDIIKGFEAGAVDYVAKPFNTRELLARVHTHLTFRRQQRELEENYRRLSKLERLRDSLVHMVVHDLRSPLLGLSGCLQLLQGDLESTLLPDQAADLKSAMTSAQQLSEMVTSLLDVSRLEAGEMPLHKQSCDLRVVMAGAIESLGALTRNRHIVFAPTAIPLMIDCDAEIVGRVIANLLSNALKFTRADGTVRLDADITGIDVKVTVADNGPGIPVEYRERIFEKFGQVENLAVGMTPSTGLGLTFCKLAVEAHGGAIGVESEVGKGSTFWFKLPV
ncbi:hybrid sensor histidine kinase/response regulator [soil metagenome]